jgi:hypothetical protein
MAIQFNRREEILERLEKEGKVLTMDSEEDRRIREATDEFAFKIDREYKEKERMSIIEASKMILNS